MNTTHRSIWNSALGAWVAVSEITRACGKRSGGAVALALACSSVWAQDVNIHGGASVTVSDTQNSPWNIGGVLFVGYIGQGTLTVQDGGTVSNTQGYIGLNFSVGDVTVTGAGSTWTNTDSLYVGSSGTGTLTVSDGGKVSNTDGYLGHLSGATGNATVTGAGSTWISSGNLTVGDRGTGRLTVADGGRVSVSNGTGVLGVAVNAGSTGVLNIGAAAGSPAAAAGTVAASEVRFGAGTGSLNFNHTDTAYTFGTLITGGGVLNQVAGTTILTGANTYSGGTTVSGGTLQGNSTSLQGNITNNAAVTFDQGATGTYAGAMSGSGVFNKTGTGNLILTGANTYNGGTTVSAGTLQGSSTSLQGNITNNAAVTFDQTSVGTYAGVMSGNGVFNKTGTGNLILTGTNALSGATSINGGTLSVNGSLAGSAIAVNSGGTLGGAGTVGSTTIAAGGVLAPGNSIGTLTINGNATFAAGSIYRVEVDAAGNNDRVNVTGSAAINGGTVDVQAGAGTYAANTQYTILNAAGGRTGNFAGVTSNLAFLTPTLAYDANNVFLSLARNDISFSAVAQTPNQIATSTALQNAGNSGDMSTVQTALTGLSAEQARAAYDSTSGAGLVALRNAGAGFAAGFGNQLQARLGAVQGGGSTQAGAFAGGPILLAANDHVSDLMTPVSDTPQKFSLAGGASLPSASSSQGRGFWLRGSGGYQDTKSDGNAAASELRNSSISAGFDTQLQEGLVVGAALSSGTSRLGFDNTDTGKSRGSAVALYGSYISGPWAFKGSASTAWNSNHMDRSVVVGAINRTASSDFDSNTLSAYGEATYSMPMNGWTLQPLAALSLSRNKTDGFTETGAGALNLQVAGQTITSTKSLLGAKASFDAGSVRLEPRIIWVHEFGDINTPMTAQFQGAASVSPFQVSGVALKRDTLVLGLGVSGQLRKGLTLVADGQVEANSRQRSLAVFVGVRGVW